MSEIIKCQQCKWWLDCGESKGRCCRYPPKVVQAEDGRDYVGRWPGTNSNDCCGEAEQKEVKDED